MTSRIYGLDILRAIAVLSVVYGHGVYLIDDRSLAWLYSYLTIDGVSIFFVLSGYLIGGIFLQQIRDPDFSANDLLHFLQRRWFRTLPNYYLVLIFVILTSVFLGRPVADPLISYFFFVQNFASPHPAFFPEAWSLAVEEWFYLLMPLGLFLSLKIFPRDRRKTSFYFIVLLLGITVAYRMAYVFNLDITILESWDKNVRKVVLMRIDGLLFGFLAAYIKLFRDDIFFWRPNVTFTLGIALFVFEETQSHSTHYLGYASHFTLLIASLSTLLVLPRLVLLKTGSGYIYRFFTLISAISYSMYLLNLTPVQLTILPQISPLLVSGLTDPMMILAVEYILYWTLTVGLAFALYRMFELPMMRLRDRLDIRIAIRRTVKLEPL